MYKPPLATPAAPPTTTTHSQRTTCRQPPNAPQSLDLNHFHLLRREKEEARRGGHGIRSWGGRKDDKGATKGVIRKGLETVNVLSHHIRIELMRGPLPIRKKKEGAS
ncbi:hypothetical protein QQ045_016863 [Rhodiola kirilowii]